MIYFFISLTFYFRESDFQVRRGYSKDIVFHVFEFVGGTESTIITPTNSFANKGGTFDRVVLEPGLTRTILLKIKNIGSNPFLVCQEGERIGVIKKYCWPNYSNCNGGGL